MRYENGSLVEVLGPDDVATLTIEPDGFGNPAAVDLGLGYRSTFTFNGDGKPLTATQPMGQTYTASYDPATGRLASIEDPLGKAVGVTWNNSEKPLSITTPTASSAFTYDGNGNIRTMADGRGGTWTYTYDEQHRLLTEEDPRGELRVRTYDDAGRQATLLDRNGELTEYGYDEDGLLDLIELPDGTVIDYEYDGLGRLTAAENDIARVELTYDPTNLVTSVATSPINGSGVPASTVTYTYDAVGNRRTMTTSEGVTEYRYDEFDRPREIIEPDGDVILIGFDRLGRLDRIERPNGLKTDWDWNAASQPIEIEHEFGGVAVDELIYAYGDSGLLDQLTDATGSHGYSYDHSGQLSSVDHPAGRGDETYAYDSAGNRTTDSSVYDANNRLTENATHTFTWDEEGRLATRTVRATGEVKTYGWDAEGRLLSVTTGGLTTSFGYDPFGRRIRVSGPEGIRHFAYGVDENAYAELDASGAMAASYLFANQIDSPIAMTRGGATWYFLQDGQANVNALADDAGAIVSRYAYDAFGTPITATGSVPNPFTYAAREYEEAAGAYYFRLRWYDPTTGRFLSEDPLPAPNLYPYANNNPLAFSDPMGAQALVEYKALNSRTSAQVAARQRFVYRFYDCGDEVAGRAAGWYYGMTVNVAGRQAQHGTRVLGGSWQTLVGGDMGWMLTRAIEQAFIDAAGGVGGLANIINSMSPANPSNAAWRSQGANWLNTVFRGQVPAGFNFNPPIPGGC